MDITSTNSKFKKGSGTADKVGFCSGVFKTKPVSSKSYDSTPMKKEKYIRDLDLINQDWLPSPNTDITVLEIEEESSQNPSSFSSGPVLTSSFAPLTDHHEQPENQNMLSLFGLESHSEKKCALKTPYATQKKTETFNSVEAAKLVSFHVENKKKEIMFSGDSELENLVSYGGKQSADMELKGNITIDLKCDSSGKKGLMLEKIFNRKRKCQHKEKPYGLTEERYPCNFKNCNTVCKSKYGLNRHKRKHSSELFKCEIADCGAEFPHVSSLYNHRRTHKTDY